MTSPFWLCSPTQLGLHARRVHNEPSIGKHPPSSVQRAGGRTDLDVTDSRAPRGGSAGCGPACAGCMVGKSAMAETAEAVVEECMASASGSSIGEKTHVSVGSMSGLPAAAPGENVTVNFGLDKVKLTPIADSSYLHSHAFPITRFPVQLRAKGTSCMNADLQPDQIRRFAVMQWDGV